MKKYPILTYHSISNPPKNSKIKSISINKYRFKAHMLILKILGYTAVSMQELVPYLQGKKQGKVVGLTFDDGYLDNYIHALNFLQRLNFTATCYVVTKVIGKHNVWDIPNQVAKKPMMSVAELQQWLSAGFEIGSHTLTHANLNDCDTKQQMLEIIDSKQQLSKLLNTEIISFCFPYGKFNNTTLAIVQQAGYTNATTTIRGIATTEHDLYLLPRINIARRTGVIMFLVKLFTNYEQHRHHK